MTWGSAKMHSLLINEVPDSDQEKHCRLFLHNYCTPVS